jgi:predicted CopG family antitoxin
MPSRTITITDAAYARLAAAKEPQESFTDVVLRLTKPKAIPLSELHRHLSQEFKDGLAEAYEADRKSHIERRTRRLAGREGDHDPR